MGMDTGERSKAYLISYTVPYPVLLAVAVAAAQTETVPAPWMMNRGMGKQTPSRHRTQLQSKAIAYAPCHMILFRTI